MKLTIRNSRDKKVSIHDSMGRTILGVSSFDTVTCAMTLYPITLIGGKPMTLAELGPDGKGRVKRVKTTWRGAYAIIDGKRLE